MFSFIVFCAVVCLVAANLQLITTFWWVPLSILLIYAIHKIVVKLQRRKDAAARKAREEAVPLLEADDSELSLKNQEIIEQLTQQAEALSTLQSKTSDIVLAEKLDAMHQVLSDVLVFLDHEPQTARKLRSMAKHYLPDFVEAVMFYDRTKDYGFIDADKYFRYIDTVTSSLMNIFQQMCEHKELAIEVNMEIAQEQLEATGMLQQRQRYTAP